ncbi:MAG: discoidin domain-containing protein [Bacteroidia bacterium]
MQTANYQGIKVSHKNHSKIDDNLIVSAPFIEQGKIAFQNETEVALATVTKKAKIFWSYNNSEFVIYQKPIKINENGTLSTYAQLKTNKSPIIETEFKAIDPDVKITLQSEYSNQYNGGGNNALIDGIFGCSDFRSGAWQGYELNNFEATIDYGKIQNVDSVILRFLRDQRSWIFEPKSISIQVSTNGVNYSSITTKTLNAAQKADKATIVKKAIKPAKNQFRYLKINIEQLEKIPDWHIAANTGFTWLFIDEIVLK